MLGRRKTKKAVAIDQPQEGGDEPFFALPTAQSEDRSSQKSEQQSSVDDSDESGYPAQSDNSFTSWINDEDKLPLDVYQDDSYIYLKSPVPGANVKDIDITIDNDLITVRVHRQEETIDQEDFFFQECFWGSLSRSIILPAEIDANAVQAKLSNGILTITLPKLNHSSGIKIPVKDQD